jgi:hypothetical protein
MNWIKIENPDTKEEDLIDLTQVEEARRGGDGKSLTIWMRSGRTIEMSGDNKWPDIVWKRLLDLSKVQELRA